jgi:hypothetical protein
MKFSRKLLCGGLLLILASSGSEYVWGKGGNAPAYAGQDAERSSRNFVQAFYTWYVPKHGVEDVLKYRRTALSPELFRALKEDLDASAKNSDEVVGLDFDPFLNAQDTAERYVIGSVTAKGDTSWVEVYGIWSGKKSEKPDAVAEVACKAGQCFFVNFHYGKTELPENENLLSVLKALKKERQKQP